MEVSSNIDQEGKGIFYYPGEDSAAGEMEVAITEGMLTVYHTEVKKEFENQGLAKGLLAAMVAFAREHHLKVTPLCPFVSSQFRRHPAEYADLWTSQN